MPKKMKECIRLVEKQIEFAIYGFALELEDCRAKLESQASIDKQKETLERIRIAVDAMEDLYDQLEDMREEEKLMEQIKAQKAQMKRGVVQ